MTLLARMVIASGNPGKAAEISAILGPRVQCRAMGELGSPPALAETGNTFEANAAMKAIQLRRWMRQAQALPMGEPPAFVLSDDSGLEVDRLGGEPGVRSARFASGGEQGNASDEANNRKLLELMEGAPPPERSARFRCVLALLPLEGPETPRFFEGACEGSVHTRCQGRGGFGYDPLFVPKGHSLTFAQLGPEAKDRLSHRALALGKLSRWLQAR